MSGEGARNITSRANCVVLSRVCSHLRELQDSSAGRGSPVRRCVFYLSFLGFL